jgi:hypothetical protein
LRFERTLNQPLAALRYLQGDPERRARFQVERTTSASGRSAVVVAFREQGHPRVIGTPDGAAASGRLWIDEATGTILETELLLASRRGNTTVSGVLRVQFVANSDLDLWLPGSMEEDYVLTDSRGLRIATVSGRASYANARRFGVAVQEEVATPLQ